MTKTQFFLDHYTIDVYAGKGGKGINSFETTKDGRKIPSGGNGGRGGDIYIRGNPHMDRLSFPKRVYKSSNGENGQGKDMNGSNGRDLFIDVPLGSCIYRIDREEEELDMEFMEEEEKEESTLSLCLSGDSISSSDTIKKTFLCDITEGNQMVKVARGGEGGEGNKLIYNRIKRRGGRSRRMSDEEEEFSFDPKIHHRNGEEGEHCSLFIELKLLASIGLIGYPNAGKSSLLSSLTRSVPKIASYPFTTLRPLIGYIEYNDRQRISMADIPGIIEGAHENHGLGLSFIKHIERTRMLAYVLDCSDPQLSPVQAFENLVNELESYDSELPKKPSLLVANKMDLPGSEEALQQLRDHLGSHYPIYPVSCKSGQGLNKLALDIKTLYNQL